MKRRPAQNIPISEFGSITSPDCFPIEEVVEALLGAQEYSQGQDDEAQLLYEPAIEIGEKTLDLEHPDITTWLNNLAGLFSAQMNVL